MDLICYLRPGWKPLIRPAEAARDWMTATTRGFAYRCLPLNIANAHGWEILSPCTFEALWTGGAGSDHVKISLAPHSKPDMAPSSHFGHGVLTFDKLGLFRTPPGWNLWVGGSPNRPKEGIYPLTGIVETDWTPATFTMNWRFLRQNHVVRFEEGEPFCFFFPVQRGYLDGVSPRFVPMEAAPEELEQNAAWGRARDELLARIARDHLDTWAKDYYRGVGSPDHQTKLRLAEFATGEATPEGEVTAPPTRPASDLPEGSGSE